MIVSGDNKGQTGRIIKVLTGKIALWWRRKYGERHTKPEPESTAGGGIIEKEASIHLSNLMLLCPKNGQRPRGSA